ncbi:transposase (plasmid) [Streptomyces cavourensis]
MQSEGAFAHLAGVAPIPASSGRTHRHRLNRGGDRAANNALHTIVLTRMRFDERTRAYAARRTPHQGRAEQEGHHALPRRPRGLPGPDQHTNRTNHPNRPDSSSLTAIGASQHPAEEGPGAGAGPPPAPGVRAVLPGHGPHPHTHTAQAGAAPGWYGRAGTEPELDAFAALGVDWAAE